MPESEDAIVYENRFGPAVDAFRKFRPGYPPEVFELILREVSEDRRERAIDLGSGTGLSALPLSAWFREVIAVEPDAQMAGELRSKTEAPAGAKGRDRRSNLTVLNATAERCDLPAGIADLVTCGTSFHWMDGPRVLARVREWLRPGGLLALYSYPVPMLEGPVLEVVEREFALHWGQFRHSRLDDRDYTSRTFFAYSGLNDLRALKIPNMVYFSPEEAVGFAQSTSYGSAYIRTLADPAPYLQELLASFREASGGRPIAADFELSLFLGRKL